jgi:hypothetical protein
MNVTTAELLFLGLPETGKTTFFVALDEVIQRQADKHGLSSDGFAANRTFIEGAKRLWRAGKSVQRTNQTANEIVELRVQHLATNTKARLTAPDVSGEFFDSQWTDRKWPVSYRERLAAVRGLFVFINAANNGRNSEINAAWLNHQENSTATQSKPWTPADAAKQVKLVDLLQFVSERGQTQKPLPLVVMLSAWDLVELEKEPHVNPDKFLEQDWSLLHQFLNANPENFKVRVYGVSARGGNDEAQAALSHLNPHERVWLKDGDEVTKDLTRPLRWLLGLV